MPFYVDDKPSLSEIAGAINYLLANFAQVKAINPNSGQITTSSFGVTGYLYKYLNVKYADSFDGSVNFSDSPTNRLYYGLRNNDSSVESTLYSDYVWTPVTGGFGTTKFFYYATSGGRQIQTTIATTAPASGWAVDTGAIIDLDIVTFVLASVTSFSAGTTGLTPNTPTQGAVVLAGTLGVANGGTNGSATPTAGAVAYGTGTAYGFTASGTAGQVLTSAGAGVPTWTTNASGDVSGPASSTDNAVARFDGTTGKIIQNSVTTIDDTGNASGILSQQFSNGSAVTLAAGKFWYDGSTGAWNLGMGNGNITQQVGEEIFVYGKASAAITDSPLQIIYHTGVVGASGVIKFAPTIAGITDVNAIIGIATESLALNDFGRATVFGVVRGITTNGTAFGETWADDDVIWYNPVTGNPTKVEPVAPYIKVQVGLVIKAGAGGSGSFQVGIARGSKLGGTDSNVQIGTLANNNLIAYDSALGYWKNVTASSLGLGTVTSVSFTGGLITVATPTTTPALTVTGTSGGVVYFSSASTWASSAALAANAIVLGGGAGAAPATTTTGTGVVTALGVNTGTAGAFVVNGGALGTPSSGTVTNLTGTASININGTVGATTPTTGSFTSVTNSGLTTGRVVYTTTGGLNTSSANLLYSGTDLTVYGITVGRGTGAISTNTAVGSNALAANTTGSAVTAAGFQAAYSNTTGDSISAVGYQAGYSNTVGTQITVFGQQAGYGNIGSYNEAFGHQAGYALSSGTENITVGRLSMSSGVGVTGGLNSGFGQQTLRNLTSGSYNTGVGYQALTAVNSGAGNLAAGYSAGSAITSGSKNVILGSYTGSAAPISATGNNYIVLSDGDGNVRGTFNSSGNFGVGTTSPSGRIHAVDASALNTALFERTTPATTGPRISSRSLVTSSGSMADTFAATHAFGIRDTAAVINIIGEIGAERSGASNTGNLIFRTYSAGASTTSMTLDFNGNLGIGAVANASAILDAQSTTKGVRMPNMTTTQKNAISSPAAGLMVFDTTLSKLCVYSGVAWQTITSI